MAAIDRRRHARQLLLAEIGETGQARLCATRLRIAPGADVHAAEVAREYLERAGVQVIEGAQAPSVTVADSAAVRALAGGAELEHAAAALAGAFAAVEAIKSALGLPTPGALPADLSLAAEV